jgi:CBS-domain-containing membrane protein
MQEHQIRRIPIVDAEGRIIGIVSQADLALKDKPERVWKTVAEISKTSRRPPGSLSQSDTHHGGQSGRRGFRFRCPDHIS